MVTFPVPVFVSETAWEAEVPTRVAGKLRLLGLGESRYVEERLSGAAVPVPDTETVRTLPFWGLAWNAIVPL